MKQPRQPSGVPVGGQFAAKSNPESEISLLDEPRRIHRPGLIELDEDTRSALDAIRSIGGRPMLVGGCVRDPLIDPSLVSKDIDVEVYECADIETLAAALGTVGRVDEVGKSFGVLKVRVGDQDLDVSLPRRDSKVADGHRGFDIHADAGLSESEATGRRDFTINSLMWDPDTEDVVDCWGGLADIESGVLRHTTDAFSEDPLRVLRGVQFASRFGFHLAPETADLCRGLSGSYAELPTERVWGEFEKIGTKGTHISAGLAALEDSGWDRHFPQLVATKWTEQDPHWHPEGNVHTHSGLSADSAAALADEAHLTGDDRFVVVMGTLAHDFGKPDHTQHVHNPDGTVRITSHGHAPGGVEPATKFLDSIGCPRRLTERIAPIVREHMCVVNGDPTPAAVRRLARRLEPATLKEWSLVVGGDHGGRGSASGPNPADEWLAIGEDVGVTESPRKGLLTGDHLIAAGMRPGPAFKPVLAEALAAQDDGAFEDEAGALRWFAGRAT
jgi:tRNA nucleotidyltransferase (CCA-adding enzyme)